MKMMIAILEDRFLDELTEALLAEKIRITKLHSTGGFLSRGNTTLLLGAEDEKLPKIKEIFRRTVTSEKIAGEDGEHTVRGANLFVVDVEKGFRI